MTRAAVSWIVTLASLASPASVRAVPRADGSERTQPWEAKRAVVAVEGRFAWSRETLRYEGPGAASSVREVLRPGLGLSLSYRLRDVDAETAAFRGLTQLGVDVDTAQSLTFLSLRQELRFEARLARTIRLGVGLSGTLALTLPRPALSLFAFGLPIFFRAHLFEVVVESGFTLPLSSEENPAFWGIRRRQSGPSFAPLAATLRFYLPPASL